MTVKWIALGFLAAVCPLIAQTVDGTLSGEVVDSSGAAVPGAKITMTHDETRVARTGSTGAAGSFLFVSVLPGRYRIRVEAQGFKTLELQNVNLAADERLFAGRLTVEVGALTESVTVKGDATVVEVENSDRSSRLTGAQMAQLMSRSRDMLTVLSLTIPGAIGDENSFEASFVPAFSGVPNTMSTVMVDGVNSMALSNPKAYQAQPNLDAIAEVSVLLTNYKAEYGRNGGAMITTITKRGTASFHGSAYGYFRNEALNANTFFNNQNGVSRPVQRNQTYGLNIGGPVYWPGRLNTARNKLFFFFSQEFLRARPAVALSQWTVPTALERQGDFSQTVDLNNRLVPILDPSNNRLQFPGNVIPRSRIHPAGENLLRIFPLPSFDNRAISRGNYNYNFQSSNRNPQHQEIARLDYHVSDRLRLYSRFHANRGYEAGYTAQLNLANWPLAETRVNQNFPSGVFNASYTASPTVVFDVLAGFQGPTQHVVPESGDLSALDRAKRGVDVPQIYPGNNPYNILPNTSFSGVPQAANITVRRDFPDSFWSPRMSLNAGATKVAGTHLIKAGLYHEWDRYDRQGSLNFNGSFSFTRDSNNPLDSNWPYSNALIGTFQSYSEASMRPTYFIRGRALDWYLQDTWKPTRRVTLDYGMRFTWFVPFYQGDGKAASFVPDRFNARNPAVLYRPVLNASNQRVAQDPRTGALLNPSLIGAIVPGLGTAGNGLIPQSDPAMPRGFVENRGIHYGPRLGIAYALTSDNKTALRAGAGVSYQSHTQVINDATPMVDNVAVSPTIYNSTFNALGSSQGVLFPTSVTARAMRVKTPTIIGYSIGIQRAVGFDTTVEASYVATLGRHLVVRQQANTVPYGARFLPENYDPTTRRPLPDNYFRPFAGYTDVIIPRTVTANYHSLQLQGNRRYSRHLQYGANFTWSSAMGYGGASGGNVTGTYTTYVSNKLNYGKTTMDYPLVLSTNWLCDLPTLGRRAGFAPARWVLDGWQWSGIAYFQKGRPFPVAYINSGGIDITGGGDFVRTHVLANPNLPRGERTVQRFFNTSAFGPPTPGTFGDSSAYPVRGPGRNNFDFTLSKNFKAAERVQVQLRWEIYNVFNHPSFYTMNTNAQFDAAGKQINQLFGQLTATRQPRQMQLALRISF